MVSHSTVASSAAITVAGDSTTALLLLTLEPQVSSAKSDMIEQNVIFMPTKLLTVILKIKFNAYICNPKTHNNKINNNA